MPAMDFGLVRDPHKQEPFNRKEVQSMGIIRKTRDRIQDEDELTDMHDQCDGCGRDIPAGDVYCDDCG